MVKIIIILVAIVAVGLSFAVLQLVLAGGGADDDPEAAGVIAETQEAANGDPNIHMNQGCSILPERLVGVARTITLSLAFVV